MNIHHFGPDSGPSLSRADASSPALARRSPWTALRRTAPIPALVVALLTALVLSPAAAALTDDERMAKLEAELAAERAARQALMQALSAEQAARQALASRVQALESRNGSEDALEAQLRGLIAPEAFTPVAGNRTAFPSAFNPRIGIYTDAVIDVSSGDRDDGDRFSLRETEIDFRLPFAPWGEGVLITAFEDAGEGEFETHLEEGYAALALGDMLDMDTDATARVGRFRVPFGHDNKLHTHDLLQVDRSLPVQYLLGEEGLIGEGVEFAMPLFHRDSKSGLGQTTTGHLAIVNGELFTGEESLLGEMADEAGIDLDSDSPVYVARVSHYAELSRLSDVEVGVSALGELGSAAIESDSGQSVEPNLLGADVTWRQRDDETGVGSWLVALEAIRGDFDFSDPERMDFPNGSEEASGWSLTAQRQTSPRTYVGLRVGETEMIGSDEEVSDISPYVSFYADEFFRIRLQGQQLDYRDADDVNRLLLQFTWNFGAHNPHPYWVNR